MSDCGVSVAGIRVWAAAASTLKTRTARAAPAITRSCVVRVMNLSDVRPRWGTRAALEPFPENGQTAADQEESCPRSGYAWPRRPGASEAWNGARLIMVMVDR